MRKQAATATGLRSVQVPNFPRSLPSAAPSISMSRRLGLSPSFVAIDPHGLGVQAASRRSGAAGRQPKLADDRRNQCEPGAASGRGQILLGTKGQYPTLCQFPARPIASVAVPNLEGVLLNQAAGVFHLTDDHLGPGWPLSASFRPNLIYAPERAG